MLILIVVLYSYMKTNAVISNQGSKMNRMIWETVIPDDSSISDDDQSSGSAETVIESHPGVGAPVQPNDSARLSGAADDLVIVVEDSIDNSVDSSVDSTAESSIEGDANDITFDPESKPMSRDERITYVSETIRRGPSARNAIGDGPNYAHVVMTVSDPITVKQALAGDATDDWKQAMREEMRLLKENQT